MRRDTKLNCKYATVCGASIFHVLSVMASIHRNRPIVGTQSISVFRRIYSERKIPINYSNTSKISSLILNYGEKLLVYSQAVAWAKWTSPIFCMQQTSLHTCGKFGKVQNSHPESFSSICVRSWRLTQLQFCEHAFCTLWPASDTCLKHFKHHSSYPKNEQFFDTQTKMKKIKIFHTRISIWLLLIVQVNNLEKCPKFQDYSANFHPYLDEKVCNLTRQPFFNCGKGGSSNI